MAVSTIQPLPKSQPDVSKLNTFNGYLVSVTRHLQPRGTVGTVVIPTMKMSKEDLLALQVKLPQQHGAGYFLFNVTDEGGTGDDTWMVKLGTGEVLQEAQMAGPNGVTPSSGFAGAPNVPMDNTAVTQILPGWFYNSALGLLYTPWRETVSWNQGEPLPKAPAHAQQQNTQHAATPWAGASQWGQQPWPGQWGGYSVQSDDSSKVKQLEERLAEERATRREQDMRAENARRDAEVRQMIADSNARFEKLIEKLATKPTGPDPVVEEMRRKNEVLERQLADDRRERENERRFEQQREEARRDRENTDRMMRELTANKSDPMIPMIMQMMTSQNNNAMEAVKAIQAATTNAGTAAERQTSMLVDQLRSTIVKPAEIMTMLQGAKGDSAELSRTVMEMSKSMIDTQRTVFEQLLDVAGSGNNPPWLTAVQSAMDRIGPIGEAIAARAQQKPQVVVQRVAVPVDAQGRPVQRVAAPQPQALAGTATPASAPAAPTVEAKPARKPKLQVVPGNAPAAAPTTAQIAAMDADAVAEMIEPFNDVQFFGEVLLGQVDQLRSQVRAGVAATTIADMLLMARQHLATLTPRPAAVELYMAEHIDVLVARVLPVGLFNGDEKVTEEYRAVVVSKIEDTTEKENEAAGGDSA